MNLTEPQAGSDLALVRTRAVPQGDGTYKIFGTKIFITYGEHDHGREHRPPGAGAHAGRAARASRVFRCSSCRSSWSTPTARWASATMSHCVSHRAQARHQGQPDRGAAVRRQRRRHRLPGRRGKPRPRVHVHHDERGALRASACRASRWPSAPTSRRWRTPRTACSRATWPARPGRSPIIHHPDVRRMLMTMRAQTEAARALAYVGAGLSDAAPTIIRTRRRASANQAIYEYLVPIVKGWSTEMSQDVARDRRAGARRHGLHRGDRRRAALPRRRILTIYEGTTAIQANDLVGRKTVRDGGATAQGHHRAGARHASSNWQCATAPTWPPSCEQLSAASDALEEVVDYVVEQHQVRHQGRVCRQRAVPETGRHRAGRLADGACGPGGAVQDGCGRGRRIVLCAPRSPRRAFSPTIS